MSQYGYSAGQPFGDPNGFTRGTQASEVDQFNQWLRSQPWWQQIKGTANGFGDAQKQQLTQVLAQHGIHVPSGLHVDDAGNFNQSRTKGDWAKYGAIAGGAAAGGLGLLGIGPLAGVLGGAGGAAADAGAGAIPALEGGGTLAANLGGAGALSAFDTAAAAIPALGGGATLAGNLGGAGAIPATSAAGGAGIGSAADAAAASGAGGEWQGPPTSAMGAAANSPGLAEWVKKLAGAGIPIGTALAMHNPFGGSDVNPNANLPPQLTQLLDLAMKRMADQEPLFQAVNQQAYAGLPTYAKGK